MRRMTRAVAGLGEGRLVDRAVGADEQVVGAVQSPAGVVAVRLGPALVLRLEHAAGVVAQAHQGGQPLAGHRAVGLEQRAAVGDRDGLAALDLADGAVVADEEAALGDVPVSGGGVKAGTGGSSAAADSCRGRGTASGSRAMAVRGAGRPGRRWTATL